MGIVYRAEQLDIEGQPMREVALKMLLAGAFPDPRLFRWFIRESRIAARLDSLHTVTVYDFGQTEDGQLYSIMELVRGPTLREVLQNEAPLPVERVVHIAGHMCEALAEAHAPPDPIVHRDLKPANIFIEQRQERMVGRSSG
jgi:serine/threonine-protein kinase